MCNVYFFSQHIFWGQALQVQQQSFTLKTSFSAWQARSGFEAAHFSQILEYLRSIFEDFTKRVTRQINLIVCEGAHFIQIHCFKGAHLTLSEIQFKGAHLRILQGAHFNPKKREIATFTWFATKARMLPAKCASSDSYVPPPMGGVGDTFEDRAPVSQSLGLWVPGTWGLGTLSLETSGPGTYYLMNIFLKHYYGQNSHFTRF